MAPREKIAIEGGWLLRCARCKGMLPDGNFSKLGVGRWHSYCRACKADANSEHTATRRFLGVKQVSAVDRWELWRLQRGVCPLCGQGMILGQPLHIDHKVAIANGGRHTKTNLQLTHARCNLRKGVSDGRHLASCGD